MNRLRQLMRDPLPLPPDAPAYVDAIAERDCGNKALQARNRMEAFDVQPRRVREIEREVYDPGLAWAIYSQEQQRRKRRGR